MKKIDQENSCILVLERGQELISELNKFARDHSLKSAWLSGLGAAEKMTIGYYDLQKRDYVWTDINEGIIEILGLTGNLSRLNDEPLWHIHGTFSGTDLAAFGGHIKKMEVGLTCEIHLTYLENALERKYDESTGLNLLG